MKGNSAFCHNDQSEAPAQKAPLTFLKPIHILSCSNPLYLVEGGPRELSAGTDC
jgi:hypothetical protein